MCGEANRGRGVPAGHGDAGGRGTHGCRIEGAAAGTGCECLLFAGRRCNNDPRACKQHARARATQGRARYPCQSRTWIRK